MECANCKYCKVVSETVGICRRFPPIQDGHSQSTIDEQPTVNKGGWCGEYKKGTKK